VAGGRPFCPPTNNSRQHTGTYVPIAMDKQTDDRSQMRDRGSRVQLTLQLSGQKGALENVERERERALIGARSWQVRTLGHAMQPCMVHARKRHTARAMDSFLQKLRETKDRTVREDGQTVMKGRPPF